MSESNNLPAGSYELLHVQFIGPGEPVRTRSLGLDNGKVVILPEGGQPSKWVLEIVPAPIPLYWLSVDGLYVAPNDNSVVVTPPGAERHAWFLLRGAPTPPPVGKDTYAIYDRPADPSANAWNAPRDIQPGPAEVTLQPIGYPFWIRPINE